jgi:hypothetical protein
VRFRADVFCIPRRKRRLSSALFRAGFSRLIPCGCTPVFFALVSGSIATHYDPVCPNVSAHHSAKTVRFRCFPLVFSCLIPYGCAPMFSAYYGAKTVSFRLFRWRFSRIILHSSAPVSSAYHGTKTVFFRFLFWPCS